MLVSTTETLQGWRVVDYFGLVSGEAIMGANVVRDFFASVTDVIGGRSGAYEAKLRDGRDIAVREMCAEAEAAGANAVVAVDLDYETLREGMMMVVASGTAVRIERDRPR
ncbi:MAG: heavy metal-binding domain-containing protein [Alphaproteobacteria bacterium]